MHTQAATARLICGTLKSHYLMIVKSNQPKLLARVQALPWAQVPVVHTEPAHRSHGRTETRTLKVVTAPRGIGFPHARQAIQITRERVTGTGEPHAAPASASRRRRRQPLDRFPETTARRPRLAR